MGSKTWPPGRPLIPQAFVDDYKRERCALAVAEIAHEVGANGITVGLIAERAKMARNTFYAIFSGQEEALQFSCGLASRRLREALEGAGEESGTWEERAERALEALLAAAMEAPKLAELALVHGCGYLDDNAGPFDAELVDSIAALLEQGGAENGRSSLGSCAEEFFAYGILSTLARRLRTGEAEALAELGPELSAFAIRPIREVA